MTENVDARAAREIAHGVWLDARDPEYAWGWGSPAGRIRAARRAAEILEGAHLAPGRRALEIGCGTGLFTELFAASGASILAVDLSPELLRRARGRGLPEDRIRFEAVPFEACADSGPFDAVVGSSVLHHLAPEAALAKIFRLLAPGGYLSFAEPNLLNPQVFLERRFRSLFPQVSPDETAFIRFRLRRLLAACGFEDIAVIPFDWLHPVVPARLIGPVSRLGRLLERLPGVREFSGSLSIRARRPKDGA